MTNINTLSLHFPSRSPPIRRTIMLELQRNIMVENISNDVSFCIIFLLTALNQLFGGQIKKVYDVK